MEPIPDPADEPADEPLVPSDAVAWTDRLMVRPSPRDGLGVVARVPIAVGEIIERVPCLPIPPEEMVPARVPGSLYHRYAMPDMPIPGSSALLFGFGALYNHEPDPSVANARWQPVNARLLVYRAVLKIAPGDEITFDYGTDTGFSR